MFAVPQVCIHFLLRQQLSTNVFSWLGFGTYRGETLEPAFTTIKTISKNISSEYVKSTPANESGLSLSSGNELVHLQIGIATTENGRTAPNSSPDGLCAFQRAIIHLLELNPTKILPSEFVTSETAAFNQVKAYRTKSTIISLGRRTAGLANITLCNVGGSVDSSTGVSIGFDSSRYLCLSRNHLAELLFPNLLSVSSLDEPYLSLLPLVLLLSRLLLTQVPSALFYPSHVHASLLQFLENGKCSAKLQPRFRFYNGNVYLDTKTGKYSTRTTLARPSYNKHCLIIRNLPIGMTLVQYARDFLRTRSNRPLVKNVRVFHDALAIDVVVVLTEEGVKLSDEDLLLRFTAKVDLVL